MFKFIALAGVFVGILQGALIQVTSGPTGGGVYAISPDLTYTGTTGGVTETDYFSFTDIGNPFKLNLFLGSGNEVYPSPPQCVLVGGFCEVETRVSVSIIKTDTGEIDKYVYAQSHIRCSSGMCLEDPTDKPFLAGEQNTYLPTVGTYALVASIQSFASTQGAPATNTLYLNIFGTHLGSVPEPSTAWSAIPIFFLLAWRARNARLSSREQSRQH